MDLKEHNKVACIPVSLKHIFTEGEDARGQERPTNRTAPTANHATNAATFLQAQLVLQQQKQLNAASVHGLRLPRSDALRHCLGDRMPFQSLSNQSIVDCKGTKFAKELKINTSVYISLLCVFCKSCFCRDRIVLSWAGWAAVCVERTNYTR